MQIMLGISIVFALILALYMGSSLFTFAIISAAASGLAAYFKFSTLAVILLASIAGISAILAITPVRRGLISSNVHKVFKSLLPPLSQTEQEAIDAGTVWWDGEIFSGKPNWKSLIDISKPKVSAREKAFLEGPATELCRMSDAWKINHEVGTIPNKIVEYVKKQGFLGMIIPKKYGGLEFSAVAQSEVIAKISNTGAAVTYLVAVPNSLGPGELLLKYGTKEQKDYYLPRLASGKDIPCFALTGPLAGSDATSIPDTGIVCKGKWKGKEVVGIKLNFSKRYITLAPIATLVGLAFKLSDPDHLIGDVDDYGITCALIPRDTKGVEIGRRHLPVGDTFLNGPIEGKDVFVPLDAIIGGQKMAGKGWRMLVNCLSVGRCITLPTGGAAFAKRALLGTSAYSTLRKQFGVQIKQFEGIQKPLARMTGLTYIVDSARLHTIQSVDNGEKPSVPSAILKYHCTEMARQCVIDAMDIHGGKAVMKGPKNYITSGYESIPVAITVEGANILTRNLMIFGQGAIRSHPYILKEMQLGVQESTAAVVKEFDETLFSHIGFTINNAVRAFVAALTGSVFEAAPGSKKLAPYYKELNRLSRAFTFVADISMLTLQSKLKFMEMLSARLGDLLSSLYLSSMVIKNYENDGCPEQDWPVVEWSLQYLMHMYQTAMQEVLQNYPNRVIASMLKLVLFPFGMNYQMPKDKLEKQMVELVTEDTATRDNLTAGMYMDDVAHNPLGHVNQVFIESLELQPIQDKIRAAIKQNKLSKMPPVEMAKAAQKASVITAAEAKKLIAFNERLMSVIHVDDFDESEIIRQPVDKALTLDVA